MTEPTPADELAAAVADGRVTEELAALLGQMDPSDYRVRVAEWQHDPLSGWRMRTRARGAAFIVNPESDGGLPLIHVREHIFTGKQCGSISAEYAEAARVYESYFVWRLLNAETTNRANGTETIAFCQLCTVERVR